MHRIQGGCHCGAVRFESEVDLDGPVLACNCSICERVGFLHIFVGTDQFQLLRGQDHLTEYRFNSGVARHWFCSTCGVKAFYRPRSHPDGLSINARCLDDVEIEALDIRPFDGRNWEANVSDIR